MVLYIGEVEKEIEARERALPSNTNPLTEKKPLMTIPLLQLCYLEQLTSLVVIVVKSILLTCAPQ